MQAAETARQFDISSALQFGETAGGLIRAAISTPLAEAELYLHGAHVTGWIPRGHRPVLFLSPRSVFAPGKPIRGGVPICFPWFGPRAEGKTGPIHGYARIREWTVESTHLHDDGRVEIVLILTQDEFHLRYRVTVGAALELELEVRNISPAPVIFEEALHTYFAVGDIHQASVSGLAGTTYIDKAGGFQRRQLGDAPLSIAKETDQVHLATTAACVIDDPAWNRKISIQKSGSQTTVVWNPWIEKTATIADMVPHDWQGMLCVETANAMEAAVHLAPGASHIMSAAIRVL